MSADILVNDNSNSSSIGSGSTTTTTTSSFDLDIYLTYFFDDIFSIGLSFHVKNMYVRVELGMVNGKIEIVASFELWGFNGLGGFFSFNIFTEIGYNVCVCVRVCFSLIFYFDSNLQGVFYQSSIYPQRISEVFRKLPNHYLGTSEWNQANVFIIKNQLWSGNSINPFVSFHINNTHAVFGETRLSQTEIHSARPLSFSFGLFLRYAYKPMQCCENDWNGWKRWI